MGLLKINSVFLQKKEWGLDTKKKQKKIKESRDTLTNIHFL